MRQRNWPWAMLEKLNSPPHEVEWGVRPECEGEDLLTTTYFSEQNELLSIDLSILVEVVIIMLSVIKSYLKYILRESMGPTAKGLRENAGNTRAPPDRRTIRKSFGSEYPAVIIPVRTGRSQRLLARPAGVSSDCSAIKSAASPSGWNRPYRRSSLASAGTFRSSSFN